jgi:hypothetical protein
MFRVELSLHEVQKTLDGIQFLNRQDLIKRIQNDFVYLLCVIVRLRVNVRGFVSRLLNIELRYAELSKEVKNSISHRGKALQQLKQYLQQNFHFLTK